jgi:formylglycine-generating enzyme required for sulfatase activity
MFDTETLQLVRTFRGHAGPITAVEFSPDGRLLLSAASGAHDSNGTWVPSTDQSVRLWDVATGKQLVQFDMLDRTNTATFTIDGRGILTGGRESLRLWDVPIVTAGRAADDRASVVNPSGMTFMPIPTGEFEMGTADDEVEALPPDDEWFFADFVSDRREAETPRHKVSISKPFEMSEHEVTVGQFRQFIEATGYKTTAEQEGEGYGWQNGEWQESTAFNWRHKLE